MVGITSWCNRIVINVIVWLPSKRFALQHSPTLMVWLAGDRSAGVFSQTNSTVTWTVHGGSMGIQKSSAATRSPPWDSTRNLGSSGCLKLTLQLRVTVRGSSKSATLVISWLCLTHTSRTVRGNSSISSLHIKLLKIIYKACDVHFIIYSTYFQEMWYVIIRKSNILQRPMIIKKFHDNSKLFRLKIKICKLQASSSKRGTISLFHLFL